MPAVDINPSKKIRIPVKSTMTSSFKTTLCLATVRMLAVFDTLQFLAFFVPLGLLCGALALIDVRLGIIPDGLNLAIAGLGLANAMVAGGLAAGTEAALAAAAIGGTDHDPPDVPAFRTLPGDGPAAHAARAAMARHGLIRSTCAPRTGRL